MFTLYQTVHTILSVFGVIINVFLLYLTLTRSPKLMRPCSALITNKVLTDIMSSVASFFVMQQFVVLKNGSIGIVPHGPCTMFGDNICYAGHLLMMCLLETNMVWLIVCYLFRYYILHIRDAKIKNIILAAIVVYSPSLVHIGAWVKAYDDEEKNSTTNGIKKGGLSGSAVYWSTVVIFSQLLITAILVIFCYFWIRNVLINYLNSRGITMGVECKILNQQLVKILTFQVCIPIWIVLGVTFWIIQYSFMHKAHVLGYCITVSFMLAPVISPFSYIIFVPYYSSFFVRKNNSRINCNSLSKIESVPS